MLVFPIAVFESSRARNMKTSGIFQRFFHGKIPSGSLEAGGKGKGSVLAPSSKAGTIHEKNKEIDTNLQCLREK